MMKRLGIIVLIVLFISCGEEVIRKPVNLIGKEKMIDILHDLALVNAAKSTAPSVLENHNFSPMEFIYQKYGIDSAQLVSSNLYYASIPLEYQDIYEKLEARIVEEKNTLENPLGKKKDSIKASK